jgi:hypothetical protein
MSKNLFVRAWCVVRPERPFRGPGRPHGRQSSSQPCLPILCATLWCLIIISMPRRTTQSCAHLSYVFSPLYQTCFPFSFDLLWTET